MRREAMKRAIIAGGSLGGLLAGNLLVRAGWDVHVYERVGSELAGRGAGIVTHPELRAILAQAGCVIDDSLGVAVRERVTLDPAGKVIGRRELPQIFTAWSRLYDLLRRAFPAERYHLGLGVERVGQHGNTVRARLADGASVEAELLVAADGIRSAIRAEHLPEVRPVYAGYVAWRGMLDESAFSPETHAAIFERFAFCLPPHEQMLGYPVAGKNNTTEPGRRRYNFVWYRPADEAADLPALLTDAQRKRYEQAIPPDRIAPGTVAAMRRAADELLAPEFVELVEKTPQPFFQPIYDLESPQLAFDRIAILGDAAFVARPHCGMGVAKAAGDARALVDRLQEAGDDVPAALAAYSRERVAFGNMIVAHARRLGAYMQAQVRTAEEREMAERYRTPEAVMRETAVPPE
jgi:2-polyprenyl-6-methoxyphenol hydroxylase-like FAD-dependent oxidoreductase